MSSSETRKLAKRWVAFAGEPKGPGSSSIVGKGWWSEPGPPDLPGVVGSASLTDALRTCPPALIVTDADSTLINQEVIDCLADLAGVGDQVAAITESAMQGNLDFSASLGRRVALLKGLPAGALDEVAASVTLTPGSEIFLRWAKSVGAKFGVVSGGFLEVLDPLKKKLGIDYVLANRLEVEDGYLTGRTVGPIVDAAAKVEALKAWSKGNEELTVAVGDGANDIPMLQTAGVGIAFCAKDAVKAAINNHLDVRHLDAVAGLLGRNPSPSRL